MINWYVSDGDGEEVGPVSTEAVLRGIHAGKIPRSAMIRRADTGQPEPMGLHTEFAAAFQAPSQPHITSGEPAPTPAARPRRRMTRRLLACLATGATLIAGGSAWGFSAYRDHKQRQTCESSLAPDRVKACEQACKRGSASHCVLGAEVLLGERKAQLAEARLREILSTSPQLTAARVNLGRALTAQDKHEETVTELAPILAAGGDPKLLAEARALSSASLLALGQDAQRAGKPQSALERLRQAADLAPSPAVDAALGLTLVQLKRYEEATSRLEKAIEASTPAAATFAALADAYQAQSKDDDARKTLQRAIRALPKEVTFYTRLAGMHIKHHDPASAVTILESYLEQDPANGEIYDLALGLLDGRKHVSRRATLLDKWRRADPGSEDACMRRADELLAVKDAAGAEATLRECLSAARSTDRIYVKIVEILGGDRLRGNPAKAHAFLDDEIKAHPDRPLLIDLKAQQYVKARKMKEAEALLDKAIADRPSEAAPYLAKARFYESVKKPSMVPDLLAAAREKTPSNREPARYALGFHIRQKQFDAVEQDLALMKQLGTSDEEVEALREQSTFTRPELSCVTVGQGPASASLDQAIRSNDVHPHQGFWTGDAVQRGFVVNNCRRVTVDASVDVTFNMREVTQLFIFVQAKHKSTSQTFHFRHLKPGEARPFSASTRLNSLELGSSRMGTLGGIGSATQVTGVAVKVRVTSPTL